MMEPRRYPVDYKKTFRSAKSGPGPANSRGLRLLQGQIRTCSVWLGVKLLKVLIVMAAALAKRVAPVLARATIRRTALAAAFVCVGCNGAFLNLDGTNPGESAETNPDGTPAAQQINQMSSAIAIRDAACYSDFELANSAIESKLAESVRNITAGGVGESAMRGEMILGLRFNANLQKRLAFDTLEECLR